MIYEKVKNLHGILQGSPHAKHLITIIIDPNSAVFPIQHNNLTYDVEHENVAINWVLVNYLKPDGPNTAAAILQAKDPQQALQLNANFYNRFTQTGGFKDTSRNSSFVRSRGEVQPSSAVYTQVHEQRRQASTKNSGKNWISRGALNGGRQIKALTMNTLRSNWDFVQRYSLYKLPVTIFATNKNKYYVVQGFMMDETLENYLEKIQS